MWFPIWVAFFQFTFLSIGSFCGRKIKSNINIPDNIWNIIASLILIFMGINKILF